MADNVSPDANITWDTKECRGGIRASLPTQVVHGSKQDAGVVWNTARLPVYSHAGCTLMCVVHSHGLEKPVQKSIHIPLTSMFYTDALDYELEVNYRLYKKFTVCSTFNPETEANKSISAILPDFANLLDLS